MRKPSVLELDGFNNYTSEVEGTGDDALNTGSRAIIGDRLKFIDPRWLLGDTDVTGKLVTAIGTRNVVTKWGHDQDKLEERILAPGEKFPNFKALNDACDRSEWREEFGKMVGPWSGQHCLYFIDEALRRYTWASPITTIGSCIAVDEIIEDIRINRKFRGPAVFLVVELGHTDFRTGYGIRQRPRLIVRRCVTLGPNRVSALPESDKPAPVLTASGEVPADAKPVAPITTSGGAPPDAKPVAPITLSEEVDDTIPW
jgi:hypothetical protein